MKIEILMLKENNERGVRMMFLSLEQLQKLKLNPTRADYEIAYETEENEEEKVVDETELADELQKEPSKAPEEESGDMPEIGTEEFTAWFKKNCNEDFLWEMLAEHVEDDTFFTWAVEHDKLYYKAFKSYQKILEKDGQPDEKISSEVDAETEENMAVLDEEVEELT